MFFEMFEIPFNSFFIVEVILHLSTKRYEQINLFVLNINKSYYLCYKVSSNYHLIQ